MYKTYEGDPMKALLFIVCLCIVTTSFAGEVSTDCKAMDEVTREKNIKSVKTRTKTNGGASSQ